MKDSAISINIFMKMALIQVKKKKIGRIIIISTTKKKSLLFIIIIDAPMDPQELMYLCSIADHSASHRILVKPVQHHYYGNYPVTLSTPELGKSPTSDPQT